MKLGCSLMLVTQRVSQRKREREMRDETECEEGGGGRVGEEDG